MYNGYIANLNPDYPFLLTVHRIRGYHFKYEWPSIEDEPMENLVFFGQNILSGAVKPFMRSKRVRPLQENEQAVREGGGGAAGRSVADVLAVFGE